MPVRRSLMTFAGIILISGLIPGGSLAAEPPNPKPSPWDPIRFLLGSWTGTGQGQPGTSSVDREYRFVLKDRFVEVRNTSTYEPQEKNPKGDAHEDRGFIS